MTSLADKLKNRPKSNRYIQDAPLEYGQAIFWIFAALQQSKILAKDAEVLYRRGSRATALNLILLAQEELSKPSIIIEYVANGIRSQEEWNKAKKKLLSHDSKIENSMKMYLGFIRSRNKSRTIGVIRTFKKMKFNPIQALKNTRESAIYTFAYEGSVLVPPRIGAVGDPLVLNYVEIITDLSGQLIGLIEKHLPRLHLTMENLFFASTDEEVELRREAYELEVEKYLYLLSFLKTNFSDWQGLYKLLILEGYLPFIVRRICGKEKSRKKYRLLFEIHRKSRKLTEDQLRSLFLHKKLPEIALKVFKETKKRGRLLKE